MKWNAKAYGTFEQERRQPTMDLVHRLPEREYKKVIDIGCGSGFSTLPFMDKFPESEIIGVDASSEMLAEARAKTNKIKWIQRDCQKSLEDMGRFDLVFSNAFVQWLGDQEGFFHHLKDIVEVDGVIAMQIPNYDNMPVKRCVDQVKKRFGGRFTEVEDRMCHNGDMSYYYDVLSRDFDVHAIWETHYGHCLANHKAIIDFISSTGLQPYFEVLDEEEKQEFCCDMIKQLENAYPTQRDGTVIFKFQRIEFIAMKARA